MADLSAIQIALAVGVPCLTCGATVVWHLALNSRTREDVASVRADLRALERLEDERHREDDAARNAIAINLARIEGNLGSLHAHPRGGSIHD